VLDPVVAIRCRITLAPEQSASVDLVYGIGDSRDNGPGLVEKYQDRRLADRVFELAWTHAQVVLRQINASEADAQLYGRLAKFHSLRPCRAARRQQRADAEPARAVRASGATPFPATCRSSCCASPTWPTSNWCASSSRPMPTGA
jgi:cellobiose phosphorylase